MLCTVLCTARHFSPPLIFQNQALLSGITHYIIKYPHNDQQRSEHLVSGGSILWQWHWSPLIMTHRSCVNNPRPGDHAQSEARESGARISWYPIQMLSRNRNSYDNGGPKKSMSFSPLWFLIWVCVWMSMLICVIWSIPSLSVTNLWQLCTVQYSCTVPESGRRGVSKTVVRVSSNETAGESRGCD